MDEVESLNEQTPNQSVSVGENGLTVDLKNISGNYSGGVLFNTGKAKAKGQIATFTLSGEAEIKVEGSGAYGGQLFDAEGNVWIEKIEPSATAVLPAGTYVIYAGHYDKEFNITSLSFADTSASSDARVQAAKDAIGAIPPEITLESADLVTAARNAYNALTASEKAGFDSALLSKLEAAESALGTAQIENVKIDFANRHSHGGQLRKNKRGARGVQRPFSRASRQGDKLFNAYCGGRGIQRLCRN